MNPDAAILSAQSELESRMQRPQRHRLLQGFPPLPLMREATLNDPPGLVRRADGAVIQSELSPAELKRGESKDWEDPFISIDNTRPLIIGIIPHTQCIPQTPACGFCTFPHDTPNKKLRADVVSMVMCDIEEVVEGHGDKLGGRRVDAIYFGGGTANLSSTSEIQKIFAMLERHFSVAQSEVTLEGIPLLFTSWFYAHLKTLAAFLTRHKRISMGIQTFERSQIERMGRQSFGDEKMIKGIVRYAHGLGLTVSGDFLFALPSQTLEQMCSDVDRAINCGLDQICLYHLVLYTGLGTPWSKDAGLVGQMPTPALIADYWLNLRQRLLSNGFVQTTLTNFERHDINKTNRRFIYEEASYNPDVYDALGFGPLSITTQIDYRQRRGVKLLRRKHMGTPAWSGDDLYFGYEPEDLKLLWVTRCLAGLALDRTRYRARFSADIAEDFPAALAVTVRNGLLDASDNTITLTPLGMFYSDAVIGTFAAERAAKLRDRAAGLSTMQVLEEPINMHSNSRPGTYGGMG